MAVQPYQISVDLRDETGARYALLNIQADSAAQLAARYVAAVACFPAAHGVAVVAPPPPPEHVADMDARPETYTRPAVVAAAPVVVRHGARVWPEDSAPAPGAAAHEPAIVCPEHQRAVPSNHGGLYCPALTDTGAYCRWTFGKPPRINGRKPATVNA